MARTWDDATLDPLRRVGDPVADAVVAAYFADRVATAAGPIDQGELFGHLVRHVDLDPEEQHPAVAAYLRTPAPWPPWAEPAKVAVASERFGVWGLNVFAALFCASLPMAYACHKGVQVLFLTARLRTDTHRRLNETAQFHIDVLQPGGLEPGAAGHRHVRHVRLMHAGARWLILNDPQVAKSSDVTITPRWDPRWGLPVNQEDLLQTLLTFTEVVFQVFDRAHVRYTPAEADAYLHTWCVVGHLLGIRDDLLPLDRTDAQALAAAVRRRQFGASPAGRVMAAALLDVARDPLPRPHEGLPASAVRFYVDDQVADLIGVPKADWTRFLLRSTARVNRLLDGLPEWSPLESASSKLGRWFVQALVDAGRGGDRAAFEIPTHLADQWGVRPG
jgi:hypothetical protein